MQADYTLYSFHFLSFLRRPLVFLVFLEFLDARSVSTVELTVNVFLAFLELAAAILGGIFRFPELVLTVG